MQIVERVAPLLAKRDESQRQLDQLLKRANEMNLIRSQAERMQRELQSLGLGGGASQIVRTPVLGYSSLDTLDRRASDPRLARQKR